jgi:cGMP-dependent 3',5'-cyclic phosphodiesterase
MVEARKLTNAERCSLFLLDSEHNHLVAKIFDGESSTEVSFMGPISFNPFCREFKTTTVCCWHSRQ